MTPAAESRLTAVLRAIVLLAAAAFMLDVTHRALRDHYTVPQWDDWRVYGQLQVPPSLAWLVSGQTGHRIPVTLGLVSLDYMFWGGHMHLLTAGALACAWLAVVVAWVALGGRHMPRAGGMLLAFTAVAGFWAGAVYDFVWGLNQGSQQTALLVMATVTSLAVYQDRRAHEPRGGWLVGVAALLAFGATFSHGVGAAVWGAVVVIALAARLPRRHTVFLLGAAIGSVVLYSHGLQTMWGPPPIRHYRRVLLDQSVLLLQYAAHFVGIAPGLAIAALTDQPFEGVAREVTWRPGVLGLGGLTVYAAWLLMRRERPRRLDVVALGLMTFAVVASVVVGLHRMGFGLVAFDRFVTYSTMFWVGAAWAVTAVVMRARRGPLVGGLVLGLCAVALLPALQLARNTQYLRRQVLETVAQMHLLGIRWDGLAGESYPRPAPVEDVYRVVDRLRTERRNIFATPLAALVDAPVPGGMSHAPAGRCRGTIQSAWRLPARGEAPVWALQGVAWDTVKREVPTRVLVLDPAGRVRGLGAPSPIGMPGFILLPGSVLDPATQWVGFLRAETPAARYVAYAVLRDGKTLCRLGEVTGAVLQGAPAAPIFSPGTTHPTRHSAPRASPCATPRCLG